MVNYNRMNRMNFTEYYNNLILNFYYINLSVYKINTNTLQINT